MKNLTPQGYFDEPNERIRYQFYGHQPLTDPEKIKAIRKKSLQEDAGTSMIDGFPYKIIKVTLADGWEDAE